MTYTNALFLEMLRLENNFNFFAFQDEPENEKEVEENSRLAEHYRQECIRKFRYDPEKEYWKYNF